ncbi:MULTISPECIES: hypothetical protein [unclassified Chelatococcus]|uniref:hypothetical protein n=1 Tax=unclassified Chelatococcus TaxID=2638111 RepID=UPI001BD101D9|nr:MULTISPECIES: hypothetical protein [unclassified Chelatococcus]MBS7697751.1 hypothetical protein [Chelatococcus sp. YT9]MBX3558392.1 hypothetical protein [Chelatococcus sp.]
MRWDKYFLINLNVLDDDVRNVADGLRRRYSLDKAHCFAPHGQLWPPSQARGADLVYTPLSHRQPAFRELDRSCKLIVVMSGHSMMTTQSAHAQIARELHGWALREVGLVALMSDFRDPHQYLANIAMELSELRIGVGWLTAYQNQTAAGRHVFEGYPGLQPAAVLRGTIQTPEADRWFFPRYAKTRAQRAPAA